MSAAYRMVVRTLDGAYRSVPRRQGLGMIAAGRAQRAPADAAPPALAVEAPAAPDLYPPELFEGTEVFQLDVPDVPLEGQIDLEPDVPVTYVVDLPEEPRGNASRQEWAAYAHDIGVEVHSGMSRNQIRDAAQDAAQSLARLPQPALPGGRLETPEDEPVTEESVTDDEDPGTR